MATFIESSYNHMIIFLPEFSLFITLLLALLADKFLGEAKRFHYLIGFGWLANKVEAKLNPYAPSCQIKDNGGAPPSSLKTKLQGTLAWCILVLPIPLTYFYFFDDLIWYWKILLDSTVIYLAIGLNSLHQHAMQVYQPLKSGDLTKARYFTGYLVSRETTNLSEQDMSRATIESMLENGHDSVIASLLYYLIGGAPLVIVHRLANTLDAMWGYKNTQFVIFGYASARLDDVLGFVSGKFCTLLYAIQGIKKGCFSYAITNAFVQGNQYKSHNGGWVMASGATVMDRLLGGSALYHGKTIHSVELGCGNNVTIDDIPISLQLVNRASLQLLAAVFIFQLVQYF